MALVAVPGRHVRDGLISAGVAGKLAARGHTFIDVGGSLSGGDCLMSARVNLCPSGLHDALQGGIR
jgi:hypothetical protein